MKKALLLLLVLASALPCRAEQAITFTTESYPPFTYRDADGSFRGAGVEQVEAMMREASLPFTMEMMPWARAITLAETQSFHCVFAAARTAEREKKFKWVSPLYLDRNVLVRKLPSTIEAADMEAAKRYVVGTHRADYTELLLQARGFPKIDLSADFPLTLNKLMEGRIDLMPMSESLLKTMQREGKPLDAVLPFSEQALAVACNLQTPDAVVAQMQAALDTIVHSKRQDAILQQYGIDPLRLWAR